MFGTFSIFVYWVLNCISKQQVLVALVTTHISWQACLFSLFLPRIPAVLMSIVVWQKVTHSEEHIH